MIADRILRPEVGVMDAALELIGPAGWYGIEQEILLTDDAEELGITLPTQQEIDDCIVMLKARRVVSDKNEDAREYLAETDWYVTRKAETGTEIPQEILDLRIQARLDIINV